MSDTHIEGTTVEVDFVEAVDGDTVKVTLDGTNENVRNLALDTEESRRTGSCKPVTELGKQASTEAKSFFADVSTVTLEFPGAEPLEECLEKYRGNYGRPLAFVHKRVTEGGEERHVDFQEHMIREGYSPYFTKYGYADFESHHRRYLAAERRAQADDLGIWSPTRPEGSEGRDYASLGTWWNLRAELVADFREARRDGADVLDPRLDYVEVESRIGEEVSVFTELRDYRQLGGGNVIVDMGSQDRPFKLFLPGAADTEEGQQILSLLDARYVTDGGCETVEGPARSYAYVTGQLKRYPEEDGDPEMVVTDADQITDEPLA